MIRNALNSLAEWPPELLVSGIALVLALIAVPIGIGLLFGAGVGWLVFAAEMLFVSKTTREVYSEQKDAP